MVENKYILSIVTVVFNDVRNIEKTLGSILKIKNSNIQFIVIDGLSSDGTIGVINNYLSIIDILISEKDNGIYDAMNKGLSLATGDSIIFMNGGDVFVNDFDPVKTILKFDYKNCILIGQSYQTFKGDIYLRASIEKSNILLTNPAHQAIFVPKKIYSNTTYDTNLKIAADYYWIQNCMNGNCVILINEIVSIFSLGGKSSSTYFKDIYLMNREMGYSLISIKSVIKFLMFNIIGRKYSFRLLYRNKYKRLVGGNF